jgi:hypothetical protein
MPEKTGFLENVILILIIVIALSVGVGPVIWGHFRRGDVLKRGVPAKARIVEIMDTGRRHNTNPVVRIRLVVSAAAGNDFPAEITMPLSPVRLTRYQPGVVVPVKYDPRSPERVAIVPEEAADR